MTDLSGWKKVTAKEGDPEVLFHEGLVHADLRSRCPAHDDDVWCRRCIGRAKDAVYFAGALVDPLVLPKIDHQPSPEEFPETMALVNLIAHNAFAMRRLESRLLTAEKPIWTTREEAPFTEPVRLLDYTTQSSVCDAIYMRGCFIRLAKDVPEAYARRFWDSLVKVQVDGETVLGGGKPPLRVKAMLGLKEVRFEKPVEDQVLFAAAACPDGKNADPDSWMGYMLPNCTRLTIDLEGVPGGGGLVRVESGAVLTTYTTRKMAPEKSSG